MIEALFSAMARQEGFYSGLQAKPRRLNNPLDLRFAGQEGAECPRCHGQAAERCTTTNGIHDIAKFDSLGKGIAAGIRQLCKWIQSGMTLRQIVQTHAPENENDTTMYLSVVHGQLSMEYKVNIDINRPFHEYVSDLTFSEKKLTWEGR